MSDEIYMRRCLDLASLAWPECRPNPMVGAVLVHKGKVLSEGYTQAFGGPHAEVMCLAPITDATVLKESTLYVSLEPCSHHGRTPPCADMLIAKGIGRLVVGHIDTAPHVGGRGIARIEAAGIEVEVGVLENECRHLNRRFFTFHEQGRPYVVLKWAETADGYIDGPAEGRESALKITGPLADSRTHLRRSHEMGILVGGATWRADAPRLDVRHLHGPSPQRFVWTTKEIATDGVTVIKANKVEDVLADLTARGIQSVLVEGGARVLQQFLDSGLYDEIRVEKGELISGEGVKAPAVPRPDV